MACNLLEDIYKLTPPKVTEVESELVVHGVAVRLLDPIDYRTITEEDNVWDDYISRPVGPTWYFCLLCISSLYVIYYYFLFQVQDTKGQIFESPKVRGVLRPGSQRVICNSIINMSRR